MTLRPLTIAALAAALALCLADAASAQRGGRGGRGGFGPPPVFENEGFQEEVGLSAEQIEKLRELREEVTAGFDREEIGRKFREAKTDEERAAVREEIGTMFRERQEKFEEASAEVLDDEQRERYQQVRLRSRGTRGLADDDGLAKDLGLSDEQRNKIREARDAEIQKIRESGDFSKFRDPEFRKKLDETALSVMTPEQREKYDAKLGPEPTYELNGRGGRDRGRGGSAEQVTGRQIAALRDFGEQAPEGSTVVADIGADVPVEDAPEASIVRQPVPGSDPVAEDVRRMSFSFRYAPWDEVLKIFADFADLTLDPGPVPPGTFNYYDPGRYTATEALDVLNGYLLQRGYVLVRRDRFLICVNIEDGIPPNLVPDVPLPELPDRGENELVRVVYPLERGDAGQAVKELEFLLGPQGVAAALGATNAVVIQDTAGNVRRIVAQVLERLGEEVLFEQIPLQFLDAYDAAQSVRLQLGLPPLAQNVSAAAGNDRGRDDRRRGGDDDEPAELSVMPDVRTGTLLVTAPPVQMRVVKEILAAIDVGEDPLGNKLERGSSTPEFASFALTSANAQEVAKTIEAMYPGSVINEDVRSKLVFVYAPPAQLERIRAIVDSIDGSGSADTVSTVIPLSRMDPLGVAMTLNNMFIADGDNAPVIEADTLGRRLLIRATPEQVSEIKLLLGQLGEDGTGSREDAGTLRTMSLGGRDPEEFLPLLERLWNARDPLPIKVVRPGRPPVVERADATRPAPGDAAAAARNGGGPEDDDLFGGGAVSLEDLIGLPGVPLFNVQDDAGDDGEPGDAADAALDALLGPGAVRGAPAEPDAAADRPADPFAVDSAASPDPPAAAEPPDDPNAPISVSAVGGQLILYSESQRKLNELEDLITRLGQAIPPRTQWTVFQLERSDATETAELLDSLIPSASVSGTGDDGTMLGTMASGLSSFGGSLMDMSGVSSLGGATSLRIIPDVRSNALYVQGPAESVRQVEELLRQIDSPKPGTERDRVARPIPVEYANVNEVADIVRTVYAEQTADGIGSMAGMFGGGRGGRGGGNPLAMLMGGGGDDEDGPSVQLSVAVDTRTSRLIVSAPDDLFRQVQDLVRNLDEAARDANRSVRFVTLKDADAAFVTRSLGAMMPGVSTGGGSIVGEPRAAGGGSPSSSSAPPPSSGGGDDGARDAMRAMFLQRMMQQRGGGGDAGGRGGGGRGGRGGGGRGGR